MLKQIWIPIVLVLIGVAIGGTFWGQYIASQEPIKVYKTTQPAEQPASRTTEVSPTDGHVHADGTWHAGAHDSPPVETFAPLVEDDVSMTDAFEEYQELSKGEEASLYNLALSNYVKKHYEKYPDCQDHEAVLADAARDAASYMEYKKWQAADASLNAEWYQLNAESDELQRQLDAADKKYAGMDTSLLSKEERIRIIREHIDKYRILRQKKDAYWQRQEALNQERPESPTPLHTH